MPFWHIGREPPIWSLSMLTSADKWRYMQIQNTHSDQKSVHFGFYNWKFRPWHFYHRSSWYKYYWYLQMYVHNWVSKTGTPLKKVAQPCFSYLHYYVPHLCLVYSVIYTAVPRVCVCSAKSFYKDLVVNINVVK